MTATVATASNATAKKMPAVPTPPDSLRSGSCTPPM
jgi:hypothetical protein